MPGFSEGPDVQITSSQPPRTFASSCQMLLVALSHLALVVLFALEEWALTVTFLVWTRELKMTAFIDGYGERGGFRVAGVVPAGGAKVDFIHNGHGIEKNSCSSDQR